MNEHATVTLVVGRRGFGKSTYLRTAYLPELAAPVVVFDPKGEYTEHDGFDEHYYELDAFLAAPEFWRASCRLNTTDTARAFTELYHYSPHVVVIEEAHQYCSPNWIEPGLDRLIRMGRLPNISTVLVSQRVRDFPQIIYSMADRLVVFQQRSVHDIAALEGILDDDLSELKSLPRDEYREFLL